MYNLYILMVNAPLITENIGIYRVTYLYPWKQRRQNSKFQAHHNLSEIIIYSHAKFQIFSFCDCWEECGQTKSHSHKSHTNHEMYVQKNHPYLNLAFGPDKQKILDLQRTRFYMKTSLFAYPLQNSKSEWIQFVSVLTAEYFQSDNFMEEMKLFVINCSISKQEPLELVYDHNIIQIFYML